MSQQNIETTTILRDGNTIIIAHPHPKPEVSLWDTLTGFFASDSASTPVVQAQPAPAVAVEQHVVEEVPVSFETNLAEVVVQVVSNEPLPVVDDQTSWTDFFSRQNIASYRESLNTQIQSLNGIDERLSTSITKFKEDKLLSLGDVRIRSILMAFSSALMYKLISVNTVGFLRKSRNLGFSFVFMGYWFVPELFNPFLRRPSLAQNIV